MNARERRQERRVAFSTALMFAGVVGGAYAGLIFGAPADHMLLAS